MDKTYFLEQENKRFETNFIVYKYKIPFKGLNKDDFAKMVQRDFVLLLKHYDVDVNTHINRFFVTWNNGEGNELICLVNIEFNNGVASINHIHNKIGVLKKIIGSGVRTLWEGDKWSEWFEQHNIDDEFDENNNGLFLFTLMTENYDEDGVTYQNQYGHNILRFDAVTNNNKNAIAYAKANGALHFFYSEMSNETLMNNTIEKIKSDGRYKRQQEKYPNLIII